MVEFIVPIFGEQWAGCLPFRRWSNEMSSRASLTSTLAAAMFAASAAFAEGQKTTEHSPASDRPSTEGPASSFVGTVTVTPLFAPNELSNPSGGVVEFTPGARTARHTHPAGQTLVILSGVGWVQQEGAEKLTVRAGDVVRFPPNVRHWHGASATNSMSHIAITPVVGDSAVEWLEQVTDETYGG
jgi:quercetin dioxygenase-like cupin family protein